MDEIRLLIASDNSSVRRGLTAIFASEKAFQVLGGFTIDEALAKSVAQQPDAVLIDMPRDIPVYIEKISRVKQECPCSLVLALTESEQCERLADILALGVDSCVPKNMMRGCLVKTVELTCRTGIICLPGSFKRIVNFRGVNAMAVNGVRLKNQATRNGENITRREMEILTLMARNHSNREIASKLFISEPTVKTHVSSILRKLGQNNRAQAIIYSYKTGLVSELFAMHE
ncbi:MAG TPA: hypothetical protein DEF34_10655 [Desulfotomaculum sp.]|nr:hypothetical protein [Desulfotomaculum sp.]